MYGLASFTEYSFSYKPLIPRFLLLCFRGKLDFSQLQVSQTYSFQMLILEQNKQKTRLPSTTNVKANASVFPQGFLRCWSNRIIKGRNIEEKKKGYNSPM